MSNVLLLLRVRVPMNQSSLQQDAASLCERGAVNLCENNVWIFFLMTDDRQKLILVLRNAFLCSRSTDAHSKYGHRKCRDTSMPLNTVGCMAIKRLPFCGQPIVKQSVLRRLIVTVYTRVSMAGRVNR